MFIQILSFLPFPLPAGSVVSQFMDFCTAFFHRAYRNSLSAEHKRRDIFKFNAGAPERTQNMTISSSSVYLQGWSEARTSPTWLRSGPPGSDSRRSRPPLPPLPSLHPGRSSQAWTASLEMTINTVITGHNKNINTSHEIRFKMFFIVSSTRCHQTAVTLPVGTTTVSVKTTVIMLKDSVCRDILRDLLHFHWAVTSFCHMLINILSRISEPIAPVATEPVWSLPEFVCFVYQPIPFHCTHQHRPKNI